MTGKRIGRREFIKDVTYLTAGVGLGASAYPFIQYLQPTQALIQAGVVEVDISTIKPGELTVVDWRKSPVFVLHRTPRMITAAAKIEPRELTDPATQRERIKHPEWLVCIGVCTHLGCIPTLVDEVPGIDQPGFFCACHGGRYDTLGRRVGGPPPQNLHLLPHTFVSKNKLIVGAVDFAGYGADARKLQDLPREG